MAEETQTQEGSQQAAKKTKKVNRLTAAELQQKISDFESSQQTKSVYYKHLLQRKRELESRAK
jgi:hypothetical protein